MNLVFSLQVTILITGVLSVLLILLQQRGASLGGGTSEIYTTRRGLEKSLFNTTIILVAIFVLSILGLLFLPS